MATFLRVASRQGCRFLTAQAKQPQLLKHARLISTSKKNKDAVSVNEAIAPEAKKENLLEKEENWMSFGYSYTDRDYDEWAHKAFLFTGIVIAFGFGGLYLAYFPDFRMKNWAQREGFLELARREKAGEILIDPNYLPADKIDLPDDEELGNREIII